MNSKMSPPAAESSLFAATEASARSESEIVLGKRLVAELSLEDSSDTLSRWMAHYLAELIHEAEVATGADKVHKQTLLRDSILALWAHRHELPNGKRPFEEFEPILRALESLDPDGESFRYFSPLRAPDNENVESDETRRWVASALALDQASKVLIDYCLARAADTALEKTKEWVRLAKEEGVDDTFELQVVRFISDQSDLMGQDPSAHERRVLSDRRRKLEVLTSVADSMAADIDMSLHNIAARGEKPSV